MIISLLIVWFMKHSNLFNFFQYLMSGRLILVHRYDIAVAQSGRPILEIHNSFMKKDWKESSLLSCNYLTVPTVNIRLASGDVTTWETPYPNFCTASVMYYFIFISILLLFR